MPEIRRSIRVRTGTLTIKFRNAIPIGHIEDNTESPLMVAAVQMADTTGNIELIEADNNNIQPNANPTNAAKDTPVHTSTSPVATSEVIMGTEIHMDTTTPENARETTTSNVSPSRTTSYRYILDKPRITEESFSKDFADATNFLQSISPIRSISMTFHKEKEQIDEHKRHRQPQTTTFMSIHQQKQKKQKEKNEKTNKQEAEENNVLK